MHLLRIHMTVPVHEVNDQGSSLTQDEQRRKTSSPTRGYAEGSFSPRRSSVNDCSSAERRGDITTRRAEKNNKTLSFVTLVFHLEGVIFRLDVARSHCPNFVFVAIARSYAFQSSDGMSCYASFVFCHPGFPSGWGPLPPRCSLEPLP